MNVPGQPFPNPATAQRLFLLHCVDRESAARVLALSAHYWGKNEATRRQLDDYLAQRLANLQRPDEVMEALLSGAWEIAFSRGWLRAVQAKISLTEKGHEELVEGIPPDAYTEPLTLKQCAKLFKVHPNTFSKHVANEKYAVKRLGRFYRIAIKELPRKEAISPQGPFPAR